MKKDNIVMYVFMVAAAVFIIYFLMGSKPIKASENIQREKIIISVSIEEGDTLWSIASEYYTEEYKDIHELISEIKNCNGISDEVKIGQKILVPYYRIIL